MVEIIKVHSQETHEIVRDTSRRIARDCDNPIIRRSLYVEQNRQDWMARADNSRRFIIWLSGKEPVNITRA